MPRMIDVDARVTVHSFDVEHEEYNYTEMSVAEALDFATDEGCPPAVDAAPVVHGYIQDSDVGPICSVCGVPIRLDHETPDWCPRCGAALDGGETNADG